MKIENILAVKVFGKDLYYNKNGNIYKNNLLFIENVEGASFWFNKYIFCYHDNDGVINLINYQNNKKYKGNIAFALETIYNDSLICYFDYIFTNNQWEFKVGLFDLSEMLLIKNIDISNIDFIRYYERHYFALENERTISCFDLNISIIWHFSIDNFPPYKDISGREYDVKIKQIVGVLDNLMWIYLSEFQLIGIDINTGKKIHHIKNILDLLGLDDNEKRHVNLNDTIHLDQKTGILKAFAFRFYFEIDLNTLQGKVKKDFGPKWNPDWRIRRSTFYQEYPDSLFFCGYYKELDRPNAFGIFDTVKCEIVWFDTTKDNLGYFYNPPQANDKLLAILDDEGNLFVYDREETNG